MGDKMNDLDALMAEMSWDAYRGVLDPSGCQDYEWQAALDAGLVTAEATVVDGVHTRVPARTTLGDAVVARLREIARGLTEHELKWFTAASSIGGLRFTPAPLARVIVAMYGENNGK